MKVIKQHGQIMAYRHWHRWYFRFELLAEFAKKKRKK